MAGEPRESNIQVVPENFESGWWHAARRYHEEEVERRRMGRLNSSPASLCPHVVVLSGTRSPAATVTTRATPANEGHAIHVIPSLLT